MTEGWDPEKRTHVLDGRVSGSLPTRTSCVLRGTRNCSPSLQRRGHSFCLVLLRHHAGVRSKYPRGSIPEQRNTAREVTAAQDPRETSSKIFTTLKTSKQKSLRRPGTSLALLEITLLQPLLLNPLCSGLASFTRVRLPSPRPRPHSSPFPSCPARPGGGGLRHPAFRHA